MSHIPNAAMKHAGPTHHPAPHDDATVKGTAPNRTGRGEGFGLAGWMAIGGTLVVGAAAALAVPLLRARAAPVPTRRGKRATVRKGAKSRKAQAK